jgi:hypothetical protein
MVRSVTSAEPEWADTERDWMVALAVYEAGLCPSCGRPRSVCTDKANEGRFRADLPMRCHATTAALEAQKGYKKSLHPQALLFHALLPEERATGG